MTPVACPICRKVCRSRGWLRRHLALPCEPWKGTLQPETRYRLLRAGKETAQGNCRTWLTGLGFCVHIAPITQGIVQFDAIELAGADDPDPRWRNVPFRAYASQIALCHDETITLEITPGQFQRMFRPEALA